MMKYETARKLHKCVDKIRATYQDDWKSKEMRIRQRAVALYFIDKVTVKLGCQIWALSWSEWRQMGQIMGFFRSDFSTFGLASQNILKYDLEKSQIYPIFGKNPKIWHP